MRQFNPFILVIALCFSVSLVLADGKFFSPATPEVNIPDQSAVIAFDGKMETLIIDTAFESSGEDEQLAWVVPLPAVPKVERRTTGLVPTLRMLCRPRLVESTGDSRILVIMGVLVLIALWAGVLAARFRFRKLPGLFVVLAFSGGSLLALVRGGCSAESIGPSDAAEVGAVAVYSREQVGSYDVATVSAKRADDLLEWLQDNGFLVDEEVKPVVESYVREGWVFAAYKLTDEASKERGRAHPLSFRFPTKEAVYPMRLTAVGNGNLALDLYVLGAQEAVVAGMTRERTAFVKRDGWYAAHDYGYRRENDPFVLAVHDEFATVSEGFKVLTKLTATLTPDQMTRDFTVSWKKPKSFRQVRYMPEAVFERAWLVSVLVALGLTLSYFVYRVARQWNAVRGGRICVSYALVFVFVFCFLMLACLIVPRFASAFFGMALLFFVCLVCNALLAVEFPRFRIPYSGMWLVPGGGAALVAWGMKGWIVIGAAGLLLLLSDLALKERKCGAKSRTIVGFSVLTLLGGGAAFAIVFATLAPRTTRSELSSAPIQYSVYEEIDLLMTGREVWKSWDREREALAEAVALRTDAFRSRVQSALAQKSQGQPVNVYTGKPLREENSPGNYTIERIDGLNRMYYYDVNGAKIETRWTSTAREWRKRHPGGEDATQD